VSSCLILRPPLSSRADRGPHGASLRAVKLAFPPSVMTE